MSKLARLIRHRRESKRLSAIYQENGETTARIQKNSKTAEVDPQLLLEVWRGVDHHPPGAVPAQVLDQKRASGATLARLIPVGDDEIPINELLEIPVNELLPVGTDTNLIELTEIRDPLKQASLEPGYTHATEAERG